MTRESFKALAIGASTVVAIFVGLIGLLSLVTGRSPSGDGAESFTYRTIDEARLTLRVYKPRAWKPEDRRPCVAWFFGGGWETGEMRQFAKQAAWLADRGLVSITVDYRVRSRHGTTPFEAVDDAVAAMVWIRDHAEELGVDPDRIAAGGGSAGGHLAAMTALVPERPVPQALILFNPILDIDIPAIRERIGWIELQNFFEISPILRVTSPLPPTLVLHGTDDPIVPIQSSEAFLETAQAALTEDIELVAYPGKTHEFYHHGLNANRDFKETMERVAEFLTRLGWMTAKSG